MFLQFRIVYDTLAAAGGLHSKHPAKMSGPLPDVKLGRFSILSIYIR